MSDNRNFIPYRQRVVEESEMLKRSLEFLNYSNIRRSIRHFSNRHVDIEIMKNIILTAGTAPSGAHKQPWTFCLVGDVQIKRRIREGAEEEEKESYEKRMSDQWLRDLEPLGTTWQKPFLEIAPWLVVVFKRIYEIENEEKLPNYYVNESVGIACGLLINAIHNAGLVTLTHTPSPMNFLTGILDRPDNERPFLLLPVGHPDPQALVPDLKRKTFEEICVFHT